MLMTDAGYVADRQHNILYGDRQLFFDHPEAGHSVDVIVDRLVMCHTLELRGRLELDAPTLPAADLLLSKLQVVRLNEKDAIDIIVLLSAIPLADADRDAISTPRIVSVTSRNWGWWRTVVGNLATLREFIAEGRAGAFGLGPDALATAADRLGKLQRMIVDAPKTARWRLRATVGERVRWYDEPEEVQHVR
jgi:hypothetical protein